MGARNAPNAILIEFVERRDLEYASWVVAAARFEDLGVVIPEVTRRRSRNPAGARKRFIHSCQICGGGVVHNWPALR